MAGETGEKQKLNQGNVLRRRYEAAQEKLKTRYS
jgi:hypothetical protein